MQYTLTLQNKVGSTCYKTIIQIVANRNLSSIYNIAVSYYIPWDATLISSRKLFSVSLGVDFSWSSLSESVQYKTTFNTWSSSKKVILNIWNTNDRLKNIHPHIRRFLHITRGWLHFWHPHPSHCEFGCIFSLTPLTSLKLNYVRL